MALNRTNCCEGQLNVFECTETVHVQLFDSSPEQIIRATVGHHCIPFYFVEIFTEFQKFPKALLWNLCIPRQIYRNRILIVKWNKQILLCHRSQAFPRMSNNIDEDDIYLNQHAFTFQFHSFQSNLLWSLCFQYLWTRIQHIAFVLFFMCQKSPILFLWKQLQIQDFPA